jgi:AcrR family transcriptional regulator
MAERILVGASRAFGRLGYAAVRVEDILLESEISRPTFYKVFATKDEVFQALSARHHQEIRERIRSVAALGGEPIPLLASVVHAFLTWRVGLGPVGRVLDLEARTPGSSIASHRKQTLSEMTSLVNQLLSVNGRSPVDPVLIVALIASLESVADALLSAKRVEAQALVRATQVALRLVGGALAQPGDPVPPLPAPP